MSELLRFAIVCPLVFLAGFVDAIAGGGGLISLPAYLISGLPVHNAIGTNKLSSCMGTALATVRFGMSGFIPWKQAACCVVLAVAGSGCGAQLALALNDRIFKIVMLVILPLTALYVLRGKAMREPPEETAAAPAGDSYRRTLLISMAAALVIGVYDGFYGPGTGTFLILILTGAAHMNVREANGITKAINLTTNLTALTVFLLNGKVLLPLGLTAGAFNVAGSYLGTKVFASKGVRSVKPIILAVLAIFFVKVLLEVIQ